MGDSEDDMNGGKRPSETEGGSAPPPKKGSGGSSKGTTRSRSGSNSGRVLLPRTGRRFRRPFDAPAVANSGGDLRTRVRAQARNRLQTLKLRA